MEKNKKLNVRGKIMENYDGYNYEKFRELAKNTSLSMYEKIGAPDHYRANTEELIFNDILTKCPLLIKRDLNVLDIGTGCTQLPKFIINLCEKQNHRLFLADSPEMLDLNEDKSFIKKIPGFFPDTAEEIRKISGGIDVIICYSVLHYAFVDTNVWEFIDSMMELLNDGGQAIIGDIPNISKRKRFFASNNGKKFHQIFMNTTETPNVKFNCIEKCKIDDSLLLSIIMRCHFFGFDAYIVPQASGLTFANRRDDIIIRKP